jgi:hypothetical protein
VSDIDDKSYLLGVNLERERIIKLLESIRVGDDWIGRDYAIALIKGEEA